ncbi:hypothetical protein WJU23_05215 [Prosthecobacter sp. SYSU 5D2]|uniref:hypothetical protein n=1 Tax=Prosthecobacter sp. SYSU 5D2 TaxID=3134134 RepID=UPI0031FEC248
MPASTYQTSLLAAAAGRTFSPNKGVLHATRRRARFECVGIGGLLEHYFDLGSLAIPGCRVVPEECRLRFTGTGTIDAKFTLKKVNADGDAVVDLSAATSTIAALTAAVSLAKPSGTLDTVELATDDMLRLYVTDGAGSDAVVPTTASVIVEVVYDVE